MEGIIVLIGIIAAIVNAINKGKKVTQNAPGKAAAPKPAAPAAPAEGKRPAQKPPTVAAPTVHPTVSSPAAPAGQGNFWQQVSDAIEKSPAAGQQAAAHGTPIPMNEGDSRECAHGSVGGSMEYGAHEGGKAVQRRATARQTSERRGGGDASLYRPAMNVQEMRRAVVMAEILKRPQERMSEQARRWSVR